MHYNTDIPKGFDWKLYLEYNEDLRNSILKTEEEAIAHYIIFGHKEDRKYKGVDFRDRSPFFFIHTYKNMGTTIKKSLADDYTSRFFGNVRYIDWELINREKLKVKKFGEPLSIDHLIINDLVEMGVMDMWDIENREFLGVVRDPIDRFLSICNFEMKSPDQFLEEISERDNTTQSHSFKSDYKINLTLISMSETKLIEEWFGKFGIKMNLNRYDNSSQKIYKNLTNSQIEKIKIHYKEDFYLFEELKNSSNIIKMKGFDIC